MARSCTVRSVSVYGREKGEDDDLATLGDLDEATLLEELKARYKKDTIYTYVGDILIALNPFKELPIYSVKISHQYRKSHLDTARRPHIYAIADRAYQSVLGLDGNPPADQCILISGESGSGKTESTKHVVRQVIELCRGNTQLERQILQVNPLLEALGNAKTAINDNSSRFGKFIQLHFEQGKVVGAKINEYLLEKSRVTHQGNGEENYHVFYYMFAGLNSNQQTDLHISKPSNYRYLCNGPMRLEDNPQVVREKYDELLNSMDLVGFSDEEQESMFRILSAVMNLGNIQFSAAADNSSAAVCNTKRCVQIAAELLGIPDVELEVCLTSNTNYTRGEPVVVQYTLTQAQDARDSMAKAIYGRLFSWIVNKINQLLAPIRRTDSCRVIGVLDIFGFENFARNSFEQACINLANEQLQFLFNNHIFKLEQEEYAREGIRWKEITYTDNQPLLDMFFKKPIGILALLDEESHFPNGTDESFVCKLDRNFSMNECYHPKTQPKSRQARKSCETRACFSITHYAGTVEYDGAGWLEKNRDSVPPCLISSLQQSSHRLLRTIFHGTLTRTGTLALQNRTIRSVKKFEKHHSSTPTSRRKVTAGNQFRNSLKVLIERMSEATPHFVRCIKPNSSKTSDLFTDKLVLSQLSYTGLLQTVAIRRDGYAVRPLFSDFIRTYQDLLLQAYVPADMPTCKQILSHCKLTGWQVGKTRVFLKYYHVTELGKMLSELGAKAIVLQKYVRGCMGRREFALRKEEAAQQKEAAAAFLREISVACGRAVTSQLTQLKEDEVREREKKKEKERVSRRDREQQEMKERALAVEREKARAAEKAMELERAAREATNRQIQADQAASQQRVLMRQSGHSAVASVSDATKRQATRVPSDNAKARPGPCCGDDADIRRDSTSSIPGSNWSPSYHPLSGSPGPEMPRQLSQEYLQRISQAKGFKKLPSESSPGLPNQRLSSAPTGKNYRESSSAFGKSKNEPSNHSRVYAVDSSSSGQSCGYVAPSDPTTPGYLIPGAVPRGSCPNPPNNLESPVWWNSEDNSSLPRRPTPSNRVGGNQAHSSNNAQVFQFPNRRLPSGSSAANSDNHSPPPVPATPRPTMDSLSGSPRISPFPRQSLLASCPDNSMNSLTRHQQVPASPRGRSVDENGSITSKRSGRSTGGGSCSNRHSPTGRHMARRASRKATEVLRTESADELDDGDALEDEFLGIVTTANKFGPIGSRETTIRWFQQTQLSQIRPPGGVFPTWLHGFLTRRQAERLLEGQPSGSFLIRVSESRLGFTLSFKAEERCRHYMLEMTPGNKHIVVGEHKAHRSLQELLQHHQSHPLSNWQGLLTVPRGQNPGEIVDYAELLDELNSFTLPPPSSSSSSRSGTSNSGGSHQDTWGFVTNHHQDPSATMSSQSSSELDQFPPPLPPKRGSLSAASSTASGYSQQSQASSSQPGRHVNPTSSRLHKMHRR